MRLYTMGALPISENDPKYDPKSLPLGLISYAKTLRVFGIVWDGVLLLKYAFNPPIFCSRRQFHFLFFQKQQIRHDVS